jgi:hypothetical protein
MLTRLIFGLAVGVLLQRADAQTFTPLFDGATLAGWKTQGGGKFEFAAGALNCSSDGSNTKNAWLISDKNYKDFIFRWRFKGVLGNSGLNFRSIQGTEDVSGMQVDLDNGAATSGSLYEVIVKNGAYTGSYLIKPDAAKLKAAYLTTDWNQMTLSVQGNHVETSLNGAPMVSYDLKAWSAEGFFAFQLHDHMPTKISLKDMEVFVAGTSAIATSGNSMRKTAWQSAGPYLRFVPGLGFLEPGSAVDLSGRLIRTEALRLPSVKTRSGNQAGL